MLEGPGLITPAGCVCVCVSGFSLALSVYIPEVPLWQGYQKILSLHRLMLCVPPLLPLSPGLSVVIQPDHCLEIRGEASGWGRKTRVLAGEEATAGN